MGEEQAGAAEERQRRGWRSRCLCVIQWKRDRMSEPAFSSRVRVGRCRDIAVRSLGAVGIPARGRGTVVGEVACVRTGA